MGEPEQENTQQNYAPQQPYQPLYGQYYQQPHNFPNSSYTQPVGLQAKTYSKRFVIITGVISALGGALASILVILLLVALSPSSTTASQDTQPQLADLAMKCQDTDAGRIETIEIEGDKLKVVGIIADGTSRIARSPVDAIKCLYESGGIPDNVMSEFNKAYADKIKVKKAITVGDRTYTYALFYVESSETNSSARTVYLSIIDKPNAKDDYVF